MSEWSPAADAAWKSALAVASANDPYAKECMDRFDRRRTELTVCGMDLETDTEGLWLYGSLVVAVRAYIEDTPIRIPVERMPMQ